MITHPKALPNNIPNEKQPDIFCTFFNDKVTKIRNELENCSIEPVFDTFTGFSFSTFIEVSCDYVNKIILSSAPKTCILDPIPTSLLKDHIDDVIVFIIHIVNEFLRLT